MNIIKTLKLGIYLIIASLFFHTADAAVGDLVGNVSFDTPCPSGTGVGIAYDGTNLWYSCISSGTDLYRADPLTGVVSASYDIDNSSGLGALAYDIGRNAIWAGWDDSSGIVRLIHLDGSKVVTSTTEEFTAPEAASPIGLDDGLAFDAGDDTLYISDDVASTIHHYTTSGTYLGNFSKAPGSICGNSGLAIGGSLLYEGFNGCSTVIVVDKSDTATPVFDFSTAVGSDPGFRDEDLECDTNTFAADGKDVMWSVEAYEPRRALAFEIPKGSCHFGGEIPEFGFITASIALVGSMLLFVALRKRK